jgi:hypothetical protein
VFNINRAKRREYERKYGKAFAMKKYREEAIEQGSKMGARTAIDMIMYMTAYTINYKLGFGKKRLGRIMYHIIDNIDAYNTGHLTHSDYEEIKKEMNKLGFYMKGD